MNKFTFSFLLLIFASFLTFCTGESKTNNTKNEYMQEFLGMFDGTAANVALALEKYGAVIEVQKSDMSLYNLKNPKIMKQKGDCFLVEFDIDIAVKIYEVCWDKGKIVKINDIGLK